MEDGEGGTGAPVESQPERKYSDADLNRVLAAERRKTEKETSRTQEAYQQMRQQVEALLQGRPVEEALAEMQETAAKLRSVEDNARIEQEKLTNRAKSLEEQAKTFKTKYEESIIGRALVDAAMPKSTGPTTAKLLAKVLRDNARLDEDEVVMVEMEVVEEGVKLRKALSPQEAVAELEKVEEFAPYFKATVAGGAGGAASKTPGVSDIDGMSMAQYLEARKNPDFMNQFRDTTPR